MKIRPIYAVMFFMITLTGATGAGIALWASETRQAPKTEYVTKEEMRQFVWSEIDQKIVRNKYAYIGAPSIDQ
jgi:hypothetical protein